MALLCLYILYQTGRSREGAWIEIAVPNANGKFELCRSREGAWIEITLLAQSRLNLLSLPRGSVD